MSTFPLLTALGLFRPTSAESLLSTIAERTVASASGAAKCIAKWCAAALVVTASQAAFATGPPAFPEAALPFSSESASAPASLEGQVLDPSGQSVSEALVEVLSRDGILRRTASSDGEGRFSLLLPPGRHLLRVRSEAFAPSLTPLDLMSGEERSIDVRLQLAALSEQVVVVASGSPQDAARAAKSVTVLGRAQLDAQGEFSLVDALQSAPSMRIARLGGPGTFTTIKTRGLRDQDTAFLVDGLPFRDASSLEGDTTALLQDLLLLNLDRIEILRGSGSSLHGSNAIAGVVNLVSDDGGGDLRGLVEAEGGGLGLARGRARIAGGSGDGAFAFSAAAAHLNISNGVDGNDAVRKSLAQGGASWSPDPSMRLRGRVLFGDTFSQLNDSSFAAPDENLPASGIVEARPLDESQVERLLAGEQPDFGNATFVPDLDDPDNQRASRFFNGLLQWEHRLGGRFGYSLNYSFLGSGRQFRNGPAGVRFEPESNTLSDLDGRIHFMRAQADYRLGGGHSLSAGYEFQSETFISTDTASGVFARAESSQDAHSFFIQDEMRFFQERLQISLAGRAQAYRVSDPQFQGGDAPFRNLERFDAPPTAYTADGSIAYFFPGTGTKLRGHVGNGYRAPSLFNRLGTTFFLGTFSAFGDPRLRPERSISFDLGIDQVLREDRVRLSATYFYTRLQETIVFDFSGLVDPATDPFGRFGGYANDPEGGLSRGVELQASAAVSPTFDLNASYTYTNSDLTRGVEGTRFGPSLGVSDHLFTVGANYRPTPRLQLNGHLYAASNYLFRFFVPTGNRDFRFDGPVRADIGGSYRLWVRDSQKVRIRLQVENLFDTTYFENGFQTSGITARAGIAYEY